MWEPRVWSLDQEDPLKKEMATRSSILAWRISWTEEPGRLQSMGSQRVRHDWATSLSLSNYLILCCPLLLLPSIFPSIRVFSNKSALCITWPKYRSFSFSISPSNEYSGLISSRIDWFELLEFKELSRVFSSTTNRKYQFFVAQTSLWCIACNLEGKINPFCS